MITRKEVEAWMRRESMYDVGLLDLLWPIVDKYQSRAFVADRGLFADEIEVINEAKAKLGIKLMGLNEH